MNKTIITPNFLDLKGLKGNELKTLIQEDAVEHFNNVQNLVCEIVTGFGKTNIAMIAIKRNKGKSINIVVPKLNLKKQWEDRLTEKGLLNRVSIYVINTYTMNHEKIDNLEPDILIIDEGHRCLNEESEKFSTLLGLSPKTKHLILSASLTDKHKAFLYDKGITHYYEVSKNWAYHKGLVPFHTPINCPIDLTLEEMSRYLKCMDEINSNSRWCNIGHIYNAYETNPAKIDQCARIQRCEPGLVYGKLKRWKSAISVREQLLYNAENKLIVVKEIVDLIDEKCLIFCKTIDFAEAMREQDSLGVVYHSKLKSSKKNNEKEHALNLFYSDVKPHMYSVDSLKEGFDIVDCRFVVRTAYNSTELDTTQITGRISRYDESNLDKESFLINFFVKPFQARGQEIESQELKWLVKNQKLEHNVVWFDSAVDVINYVKQIFNK